MLQWRDQLHEHDALRRRAQNYDLSREGQSFPDAELSGGFRDLPPLYPASSAQSMAHRLNICAMT